MLLDLIRRDKSMTTPIFVFVFLILIWLETGLRSLQWMVVEFSFKNQQFCKILSKTKAKFFNSHIAVRYTIGIVKVSRDYETIFYLQSHIDPIIGQMWNRANTY